MTFQNHAVSLTFEQALALFKTSDVIALDTETNALDVRDGSGYAIGVSLSSRMPRVGIVSTYLPFKHDRGSNCESESLYELKQAIESYEGWLVFHNAKFDLESLKTLGINYTGRFYCTMQIAHLLNEELPQSKSLDACVRHYCKGLQGKKDDASFKTMIKFFGWAGSPAEDMYDYAQWDAHITYSLMETLYPLMEAEGLIDYWNEKQHFYDVIRTMESRGVRIDPDLCLRMISLGEHAMEDIVEILQLNPGSSTDLAKLLLEELRLPIVKTSAKTGKPSFDKFAMEEYEAMLQLRNDATAHYILEYRGWQKSVSSNYRPYLELLSLDGRLHPNYKLHGTKTGRMSCEKPNLQQIPRVSDKAWNGALKSAFIPAEGYRLWEADYGQLEFRLATAYADEGALREIFDEGRDVFTEMSLQLGMARHDTKTLVYTIQYGGGIARISSVFGKTPAEAREIRETFYSTYPGFRAISNLAQRKVVAQGSLQLWSGRRRHFIHPKDEAHKGFNAVIQGGAADIVERTMSRVFREIDHPEECRMLLQVHDSLVFEIRDGLEAEYLPRIKACMEAVTPDFGVKFAVDVHEWGK